MQPEVRMPGSSRHRDWWVNLGMSITAVAAAVSSFSGLRSLAEVTGWGSISPLFALCLDAYALTAIRVWVARSTTSARARTFAKFNAAGAILLSQAGNAVWHLNAAGLLAVNWVIVLAVGSVPPVILGLVAHLAVLRSQPDTPVPRAEPLPVQSVPQRTAEAAVRTPYPAHATEDELLEAARVADATWRASHDGRPINRDELRKALSVSGTRASAVLRALRAERAAAGQPTAS